MRKVLTTAIAIKNIFRKKKANKKGMIKLLKSNYGVKLPRNCKKKKQKQNKLHYTLICIVEYTLSVLNTLHAKIMILKQFILRYIFLI